MKAYHLNKDALTPMSVGVQKEWVLTNGIGGYAGSSVTGAHARKHHGYLIASLHPPVERFVILSKINECLIRSSGKKDFTVEQYLAGDGSTDYICHRCIPLLMTGWYILPPKLRNLP